MKNLDNVYVILPLFNESKVLGKVIDEVHSTFKNIIVVDDGSTDNSYDLLLKKDVTLIKHPINLGQGAAIATGFEHVKKIENAFAVITFDADGQHSIDDAKEFAKTILDCEEEIIFGSRFLGNEKNIPFVKRNVLKIATFITNIITGMKLSDTHNGLKAIKKSCLKKLDLDINGYAFESQLIYQISKHKISYRELPANIIYTDYSISKGQSIRNGFIIIEDIIQSINKK
jgi:glycosyltransferase involved in cell wall biosynthesis